MEKNTGPLFDITGVKEKINDFVTGAANIEVYSKHVADNFFLGTREYKETMMDERFPDITVIVVDRKKTMIIGRNLDCQNSWAFIGTLNLRQTESFLIELPAFFIKQI